MVSGFLTMGGQLVLAILIIVGIHELGHLLTAKYFGMRVERYFIGFPPKIFSVRYKGTEYGLGCIPFGGFVKISGMMDESMDTKSLKKPPQPWEFRAKPAWQRLVVMLGGIIFNVLTGILVFFTILYLYGEQYVPGHVISTHGIVAHPLAERIGLRTGDKIISVNGETYQRFSDLIAPALFLAAGNAYTVQRDGAILHCSIPENFIEDFSVAKKKGKPFIEPRTTFSVDTVLPESGAALAGLQTGDAFLSINGTPVTYFDEFKKLVAGHAGETVSAEVQRATDTLRISIAVANDKTMGFYAKPHIAYNHAYYSLLESLQKGTEKAVQVVWTNMMGFSKVITGKISAKNSLMGPVGIAKMFGSTWDWLQFWHLVGLISMVLAFMNLLPIPALDGGHAVLCLYELVTRRVPSEKFMQRAQSIGMVLLLSLMAFAIFNDIINL